MRFFNILFLRSFLFDNNLKFIEGIVYEDNAFFDCTIMVKKIGFIEGIFYHYVRRADSTTMNNGNIIDTKTLIEEGIVDLNSLRLVEEAIDRLPSLLQILKNETNCILWGAAGIGQEVLLAQKILGVKAIKKVVDNNPAIVGQNLLGYTVQKPDMKNVNTDYRYIITGRKSTPELKRQLMSAGVNEEKIIEIKEGVIEEVLKLLIQ